MQRVVLVTCRQKHRPLPLLSSHSTLLDCNCTAFQGKHLNDLISQLLSTHTTFSQRFALSDALLLTKSHASTDKKADTPEFSHRRHLHDRFARPFHLRRKRIHRNVALQAGGSVSNICAVTIA